MKFYKKTVSLSDLWVVSNDNLSDFYASSWQRGDSPVPLLVVRVLLTTAIVGILVWKLIGVTPYWLIYLTNWGLVLVALMMLSGVLVSLVAFCQSPFEKKILPWYVSMYWFLYNVTVTIAILITALYWILLYEPVPPEEYDPVGFWSDIATHGLNSCIAVAEMVASRTPVRLLHVYQPLAVGIWYAAFSGIYYAAGGTDSNGLPYVYEVLDWRKGGQAGGIVAAAAGGIIIIYVALWAFALGRDKLSRILFRTPSFKLPTMASDINNV